MKADSGLLVLQTGAAPVRRGVSGVVVGLLQSTNGRCSHPGWRIGPGRPCRPGRGPGGPGRAHSQPRLAKRDRSDVSDWSFQSPGGEHVMERQ